MLKDSDLEDDEGLFDETLPLCSFNFVAVCILMPFFNGQINALLTPAFTLHFLAMGWDVVRCGLAMSLGFLLRMIVQHILLRTGYWMVVPLCAVNLAFAITAIFFHTSEWAIFAQIMLIYGIDAAIAIEGISFDTFGYSEVQARAASSITLSTFTLSVALSCTIGGVLYDTLGWVGLAGYHTFCEALLIFLLCVQGGFRHSFMETFFPRDDDPEEVDPEGGQGRQGGHADMFTRVVPGDQGTTLPGAVEEMEVLDVDEEIDQEVPEPQKEGVDMDQTLAQKEGNEAEERRKNRTSGLSVGSDHGKNRTSGLSAAHEESKNQLSVLSRDASSEIAASHDGLIPQSGAEVQGKQRGSTNTRGSSRSSTRPSARRSMPRGSMASAASGVSLRSGPRGTRASRMSRMSVASRMSHVSRVSDAAQLLSYGFGVSSALQPHIVGTTGQKSMPRHDLEVLEDMIDREDSEAWQAPSKAGIPKDLRFPAALIVLTAFFNNMTYSMEFATFAIFYKEVHNWNQATFASIAQTAGDVIAAISIQVLTKYGETEYDALEAGCLRRFLHYLTSSPYNLSFLLVCWILLNMGMISPVLPVAIAAQVLMGTVYVYGAKWTGDMNLFYSLGEPKVFMALQVMTKNAEAFGGAVAAVVGIGLYSWAPAAPFAFCAISGCLVFVIFTSGFFSRLGIVEDIELAEAQRARRSGIRRVSSWKSVREDQRNTVRKTLSLVDQGD